MWKHIFTDRLGRMKIGKLFPKIVVILAAVTVLGGCINDTTTDIKISNIETQKQKVESILSRTVVEPVDSLTMLSRQQSDVDNLMMGRVIFKDSVYTLAIKREDAIFLGVSEKTYDRYQEYVEQLNNITSK